MRIIKRVKNEKARKEDLKNLEGIKLMKVNLY